MESPTTFKSNAKSIDVNSFSYTDSSITSDFIASSLSPSDSSTPHTPLSAYKTKSLSSSGEGDAFFGLSAEFLQNAVFKTPPRVNHQEFLPMPITNFEEQIFELALSKADKFRKVIEACRLMNAYEHKLPSCLRKDPLYKRNVILKRDWNVPSYVCLVAFYFIQKSKMYASDESHQILYLERAHFVINLCLSREYLFSDFGGFFLHATSREIYADLNKYYQEYHIPWMDTQLFYSWNEDVRERKRLKLVKESPGYELREKFFRENPSAEDA